MNRRTTLTAEADDLRTLETEARLRGISLNALLRELVHERARALRQDRQPRGGLGASGKGRAAQESADDEPAPVARPYAT